MNARRIITVRNAHWIEDGNGGGRSVEEPSTEHEVEIIIDVDRLACKLGPAAVRSKGQKSVEAGGAVIVRHIRKVSKEIVNA